MKKKILFLIMATLAFCLLAISVSAVEVDGIHYTFTKSDAYPGYNGTATVNSDNRTLGALANVVIPEVVKYDSDGDKVADEKYIVTEIASSAFGSTSGSSSNNQVITSVVIPKTVRAINPHAFRNLKSLETVVINASGYNLITGETSEVSFSNAEFYGCSKLLSVDMSQSNVTKVGDNCFTSCSELHTVLFSKNIKTITYPFDNCTKMTTISSLETLESIGSGFYDTKVTGDLKLYNLKSMGVNAFRGTNISSVDFTGAPIEDLPERAFNYCTSLENIILPDSLKTIGSYAFQGVPITSISFPSSLTHIYSWAFNSCSSLKNVEFSSNLEFLGANSFQNAKITSVILPETLTTTEKDIFNNCPIVTAVLPANLSGFTSTLFSSCNSLKVIVYTGATDSLTVDNGKLTGFQISDVNGAAVDSIENYDPSATYSTKTIFANATRSASDFRVIVDFDGFDKSFRKIDMASLTQASYDPMFIARGYSASLDGSGFGTGFEINQDSLAAYKALIGKTISFGIVVFNPKYLGNDSFLVDGKINTTSGAIQVLVDSNYTNCSLLVNGFDTKNNPAHTSLELVFAGYVLTDDGAELIQKEYTGTQESPVSSPMASKVTRGNDILYTIKLQTVMANTEITAGKNSLDEFVA